jgi:carboxypeptidase family protein/TonB-dependent receptor-like protein
MLKQIVKVLCLFVALCLGASLALGQARSSSADLTGTVSDPSKTPIRGASVTATNLAIGLARSAMTDVNGAYRIPVLPPGVYEVKIELNGFSTQIKKDVTLTVGQTLTLNFEMALGGPKEAVVIETDEPVIESERTHQASTITQRPINELPINGRNFLDFARLTPGVVEEPSTITNNQIGALQTSGLSFAGQNGRANSVQIDGVDNNDTSSNSVRPTISQEAVAEFQINRNGYDAEFGRATGGIINIVSKSGTNQFHGNIYNYFRNERLDGRNVFASALQKDPPFKRNQPGFTFGGPIKKDKAFIFAAYEGLIRRESTFTTILSNPTILQPTALQQDLINTLIGSGDPLLVGQGQGLQAALTTSQNGPNRNTFNLLSGSTGVFPIIQTSSTGSARLDYGLNEQDFLFLRYSLTNDSQHNVGVGGLFAPSSGFDIGNRDSTFVFGETHVFRSGSSNEFRFQSVRNTYNVDTVDPFGPRLNVAGIGFFGREFSSPSDRTQRRIQFLDNFSLSRGRNNFKFGADFSRYTIDTVSAVFLGGNIDFAQLPIPLGQVLPNAAQIVSKLSTPRAFGGLGRPDLVPVITDGMTQPLTTVQQLNFGLARSINQGFGNPNARLDGQILGLYLQDGFKARPNLSLSFGLRYDYDLQPSGAPRDNNNFGPRFSFAYDPFNDQRTVIRGGGGIYYQSLFTGIAFIPSILGNGAISTVIVTANGGLTPISPTSPCGRMPGGSVAPSFCFYNLLAQQGLLAFPSTGSIPESAYSSLLGLTRATSTNRQLIRLAPDAVNGYGAQASLGVDRQIGRDWNISINYLFNRGVKLIRARQVNALQNPSMPDVLGRPTLTGRIDPTRLADYVFESAGNSIYHGVALSVNKRFNRYYQVIGSYTFSKTIGDADDVNFSLGPQDPTNVRADRALSSFDVRHRVSLAAIVESPYSGGSGSPLYQRALAGFYLSPIVTARSGFPFNIQTGFDVNLDTNNNDRPVTVGRNTGLGPLFFSTDMRVGRRIRFGADSPVGIELIFDAFNLFNRTNFKDVNGVTGGALSLSQYGLTDVRIEGVPGNAATQFCGFTSAYAPRIIQLGAKINF